MRCSILALLALAPAIAAAQQSELEAETPWYEQGDVATGWLAPPQSTPDQPALLPEGPVEAPAPASEARAPEPAEPPSSTSQAAETSESAAAEADEVGTASSDADERGWGFDIRPYATIVGGLHYQDVVNRDDDDERQDRFTTVAMTRFGFTARLHEYVSIQSELDLNAGPHGTSVWEGQAALQIRNQLLRVEWGPLRVEAGRITDPSSVDFFSGYIANLLMTDPLARFPLLVSGFNRGNGALVAVSPLEGLSLGLTVNAGNPTSTTGTVQIGGTFPPFSRFYEVPASHVGRDSRGFPADSFHALLVSPSARYEHKYFRAQVSLQWLSADTNTGSASDAAIRGMNLRGGVQLRLWDDRIRPFFNVSRIANDVVDPSNTELLLNEQYEARTISGGFDFEIWEGAGIGGQYARVREQQGAGTVIIRHYWNVGGTWWFVPNVGLDARAGIYARCDNDDCRADGERSFWLTLRGNLGGSDAATQQGRRP